VSGEYGDAAEDAAVAAVVAHGLFSPLAVLSGAAFAVRSFGGSLSSKEYEELTAAVLAQSEVLTEGLDGILRHCTAEFADAAWVVESVRREFRDAADAEHGPLLAHLESATEVLRDGLQALVRGLPPEVVRLLDGLRDQR
jgi:hypothetical protein